MPKRLQTTTVLRTGWQPDPSGGHELRLFSPEGAPTAHVRSNGRNSYEEMPGAVVVDPLRPRGALTTGDAGLGPEASRLDESARARIEDPQGRMPARALVRRRALLVVGIILLTTVDRTRGGRRPRGRNPRFT